MTQKRDIGWRLENWARWATAPGSRSAACQTGAICENMRRAVEGTQGPADPRRLDEVDAQCIERAWVELEWFSKELLRLFYIEMIRPGARMNHNAACRLLSIPIRPASVFAEHFRRAQAAIDLVVQTCNEEQDA